MVHRTLVAVALGVALLVPTAAGPAAAGDDPAVTSTTRPPVRGEAPSIIPKPNSGRAPEDPGDRGGALQITVFVLIVAGVGTIAFLAYRSARTP